jgi:hypothetical protein
MRRVSFLLAIIFSLLILSNSGLGLVKRWAVIVGVTDYPPWRYAWEWFKGMFTQRRLAPAHYASAGAHELGEFLKFYWGPNVTILRDSEATKSAVREAIERVRVNAKPDDIFLFFFAGHGVWGRDKKPIDERDKLDEYIRVYDKDIRDDELSEWISSLPTKNV